MTTITNAKLKTSRSSSQFYWRSFFSLFLVSSMLILSITGVALYVAPSGRVAETTAWHFLWINKTQWEAMHTVFSILWIPIAVAHTWLNWKPIRTYLRDRARKAFAFKRELVWTLLVTAFFGVASITNWTPVSQIMSFGESFTTFWETQGKAAGYYVPTQTELHPVSSTTTTSIAATPSTPTSSSATGATTPSSATVITEKRGVGRFTVEDVAKDANISTNDALARLEKLGVKAKFDEKLLALSGRSGYSPLDLDSIIRGKPLEVETPVK